MRTFVDLHAFVDGDGMAATLMPVMTKVLFTAGKTITGN